MLMPEIALAPDIRGVCKVAGTLVMSSNPRKIAIMNSVMLRRNRLGSMVRSPRSETLLLRMDRAIRADQDTSHALDMEFGPLRCTVYHIIILAHHERSVFDDAQGERRQVVAVEHARRVRQGPGRFCRPTTVTPSTSMISPGTVDSQFPPTSAFMSTTTAPRLKDAKADVGTVMGAGRPKILAVVMMTSASDATSQTVSFTFWMNSGVGAWRILIRPRNPPCHRRG